MLLHVLLGGASAAERERFFSVNYGRARAAGMAGAFTAVPAGWEAAFYNPATLQLVGEETPFRISVFLNPLASASLYNYYQRMRKNGRPFETADWASIMALLPRAVFFSTRIVEFGWVNFEELESREPYHPHIQFFEADNFFNHYMQASVIRIRLAEQIALGGGLTYFTTFRDDSLRKGFGVTYGVLIRPSSNVRVGVVFFHYPQKFQFLRLNYDRFVGETVNIGVAFQPFSMTTLAIDVRNLSEDNMPNTREVHFGFEQGIWRHFYLRGGYFREASAKANWFSAGIGLLRLRGGRKREGVFSAPTFALNYAVLFKENGNLKRHFLSFSLGF